MDESRSQASVGVRDIALPAPNTTRWVARRKALVVAAVRQGALSLDEACRRYALTVEEFLGWQTAIERYGLVGLRATRPRRRYPLGVPRSATSELADD